MIKFLLVVNPVSGRKRGRSIAQKAIRQFTESGITVATLYTKFPNHAIEAVNKYDLSNCDAIIVIGGDGTMHEVINGLMKRGDNIRIPLGLIPAGTGNSLMHDLGLLDPERVADVIIKGHTRPMDIFDIRSGVDHLYAFNVIGWGIPGDVNVLAEKLRFFRGQRYNMAALWEIIRNRQRQATIHFDNETLSDSFGFIVACNTRHSGNGMQLAPEANIGDGYIHLLLLHSTNRIKLVSLFHKVFSGSHLPDPDIIYRRVKTIRIQCSPPVMLNIDGQNAGTAPCEINVLPGRLEIFTKPE